MYSLVMFLGMAALYFFIRHLKTLKRWDLIPAALFLAILFYISYSSVLFILFSQILWFYRVREDSKKPTFTSFLILNGVVFLLCLPWLLFILLNYHGQPVMDSLTLQDTGSFPTIVYGILNDWAPHLPLWMFSIILLILLPFISRKRSNALILLGVINLPVGGLYSYCKLLNVTQFITSRYFIGFLPLFFITLYLSLDELESRFERSKKFLHLGPKLFFLLLLILSNLIILFPYYRSEKQDFRALAYYLNTHVRDGDKIVVGTFTHISGILHYFRVEPKSRHYEIPYFWKEPGKLFEFRVALVSNDRNFTIYHSNVPYTQYVRDGRRLWILVGKEAASEIKKNYPFVLKGYFDGSFAMFRRFPSDASMYLFLWDPKSRGEKGVDTPIE